MSQTRVRIYTAYERIWHWVQALAIVGLLLTGLELHAPDRFTPLGFRTAVLVHSALGAFLLLNAFLGLFHFLTSGAIKQYVPEPRDFFTLAFKQLHYYTRGMFQGAPHPIEKRPEARLNPLQKVTYLAILNVLLPLQVVSGVLAWGIARWPGVEAVVGLPTLLSLHTLGAWLFAAFLVLHIYLTTTGETPLANLRAMVTGWEPANESHVESETLDPPPGEEQS